MKKLLSNTLAVTAVLGTLIATQACAQVTVYEHDNFSGRFFTTPQQIGNFEREGFSDHVSSIVVINDRWEVCEEPHFQGRCLVLRPGRYASLAAMGMNDHIASVRMLSRNTDVDERRYAPAPVESNEYRRRDDEKVYEANVMSVHAIVGPPERRCWVEHEQVVQEHSGPNVPGAIAGALIGGILGHQVGGGRGNDLATAGGAVAGAAVGANAGRGGDEVHTQDVQRCADTSQQAKPEYWDVTYSFRDREHHVQLTAPPGRTILVNDHGEPRG